MKSVIIALIIAIGLAVGGWYFMTHRNADTANTDTGEMTQTDPNAVVATVNGAEITQGDLDAFEAQIAAQQGIDVSSLDDASKEQLQTQVMETLISQELLRQAAEAANASTTDEAVDAQLATIKGQFADEAAYANALMAEGVTEAELREQIRTDLETQAFLEQQLNLSAITATDEEVTSAYDEIAAGGGAPPLEDVRDQVRDLVIQQKQQELLANYVAELRADAEVTILI